MVVSARVLRAVRRFERTQEVIAPTGLVLAPVTGPDNMGVYVGTMRDHLFRLISNFRGPPPHHYEKKINAATVVLIVI
jgi:hypothetical protein